MFAFDACSFLQSSRRVRPRSARCAYRDGSMSWCGDRPGCQRIVGAPGGREHKAVEVACIEEVEDPEKGVQGHRSDTKCLLRAEVDVSPCRLRGRNSFECARTRIRSMACTAAAAVPENGRHGEVTLVHIGCRKIQRVPLVPVERFLSRTGILPGRGTIGRLRGSLELPIAFW